MEKFVSKNQFQINDASHLNTYAKFSEKLTFLTPWCAHVCVHIRGIRNVSFLENFAYEFLHKTSSYIFYRVPNTPMTMVYGRKTQNLNVEMGGCQNLKCLRDHPFSKYGKCSGKLKFLTPWYALARTCACQGVKNVSFSENFVYVLNRWSLTVFHKSK